MMQSLLLQECISDLRSFTRKVEVSANRCSCYRLIAPKGIIVEGIARLLQVLPKAIVGVFEVEHLTCFFAWAA